MAACPACPSITMVTRAPWAITARHAPRPRPRRARANCGSRKIRSIGKRSSSPSAQHGARPAIALLRRLKHQLHRAGPVLLARQQRRRAEQAGGMAVMPAGMHHARLGGGIGRTALLGDRQRVHIGAQSHAAIGVSPGDGRPPRPLPPTPVTKSIPKLGQTLRHEGRRGRFLQREFRVGVKMTPPPRHRGSQSGCRSRRLQGLSVIGQYPAAPSQRPVLPCRASTPGSRNGSRTA